MRIGDRVRFFVFGRWRVGVVTQIDVEVIPGRGGYIGAKEDGGSEWFVLRDDVEELQRALF